MEEFKMTKEQFIIEVFSDGSSVGEKKAGEKIEATDPAGWGYVMVKDGEEIKRDLGQLMGVKIGGVELAGIKNALIAIDQMNEKPSLVKCYIDRQEIVGVWNGKYVAGDRWVAVGQKRIEKTSDNTFNLTKKGQKSENVYFWNEIITIANKLKTDIEFVWMPNEHDSGTKKGKNKLIPVNNPKIPSYANEFNAVADQLANKAKLGEI